MKIEEIENIAVVLEPKDAMIRGLDLLSKTVQVTLGPAGQCVGLNMKISAPTYTKDGVTVARNVWSKDVIENAAIQTVIGAANEMNALVGDGTTTTVILTCDLAKNLLSLGGKDYPEVLHHLRNYFNIATEALKSKSRKIDNDLDTLKAIADIACNGDAKISELVAQATHAVGPDGIVTYQDSPSGDPSYEVSQGIVFDRGYVHAFFVSDVHTGKVDLGGTVNEACLIFVSADGLADSEEVTPILEAAAITGQPVLVIAPDITLNALGTMLVNSRKGTVKCCAVRAPGSGEKRQAMLSDIAVATGGKLYSCDTGKRLRDCTADDIMEYIGKAGRAIISDHRTVIIDARGDEDEVKARVEQLKQFIEDNPLERAKFQERIAQLTGGIATVYVPGINKSEKNTGRFTVEDGISACMAALRGGILPGGGCPFRVMRNAVLPIKAKGLSDQHAKDIFLHMITKPVELLIANAVEAGVPAHKTYALMSKFLGKKGVSAGLNVRTMQFGDLDEMKIWEPALVSLTAMRLAFSCATTLGNTSAMIVQKDSSK